MPFKISYFTTKLEGVAGSATVNLIEDLKHDAISCFAHSIRPSSALNLRLPSRLSTLLDNLFSHAQHTEHSASPVGPT